MVGFLGCAGEYYAIFGHFVSRTIPIRNDAFPRLACDLGCPSNFYLGNRESADNFDTAVARMTLATETPCNGATVYIPKVG